MRTYEYLIWRMETAISYNNLWKLLIDKGMNKGDFCKLTGMSSSIMAKMINNDRLLFLY